MNGNNARTFIVLTVFAIVGILLYQLRDEKAPILIPEPDPVQSPDIPPPPPTPETVTLADDILSFPDDPKQYVQELHHLASNVLLLNKNTDTRHYATNADLAELLLGENVMRTAYIAPNSPALSPEKQLIDNYGTPVIIHVQSADRFTIRSAGPDRKAYTEDDAIWPPESQ